MPSLEDTLVTVQQKLMEPYLYLCTPTFQCIWPDFLMTSALTTTCWDAGHQYIYAISLEYDRIGDNENYKDSSVAVSVVAILRQLNYQSGYNRQAKSLQRTLYHSKSSFWFYLDLAETLPNYQTSPDHLTRAPLHKLATVRSSKSFGWAGAAGSHDAVNGTFVIRHEQLSYMTWWSRPPLLPKLLNQCMSFGSHPWFQSVPITSCQRMIKPRSDSQMAQYIMRAKNRALRQHISTQGWS